MSGFLLELNVRAIAGGCVCVESRDSKVIHQNVTNVLFVDGRIFHFILSFSVMFDFFLP